MRTQLKSLVVCAVVLAAVVLLFLEIKVPAVGIDVSGSAVRGALGVSLADLSFDNSLGESSFLLNGGFVLLAAAFACFAAANRRRAPVSGRDHQDHRRSGDYASSI